MGPMLWPVSLELLPRFVLNDANSALMRRVPSRTRVFLPHLPGSPFSDVVDAASRVQALGLQPVPHVAARRWTAASEANDALMALRSTLVDGNHLEVLLIGGEEVPQRLDDAPAGTPAASVSGSAFNSALDFIQSGLLAEHGVRSVGVAAHPQGLPAVAPSLLHQALSDKASALSQQGIAVEAVTQFCFDAPDILQLASTLPGIGISRLSVGVPGPTPAKQLVKFCQVCNVPPPPAGVIRPHEQLVQELAAAMPKPAGIADLELGLHVFAFGGLERALDWLERDAAHFVSSARGRRRHEGDDQPDSA